MTWLVIRAGASCNFSGVYFDLPGKVFQENYASSGFQAGEAGRRFRGRRPQILHRRPHIHEYLKELVCGAGIEEIDGKRLLENYRERQKAPESEAFVMKPYELTAREK